MAELTDEELQAFIRPLSDSDAFSAEDVREQMASLVEDVEEAQRLGEACAEKRESR